MVKICIQRDVAPARSIGQSKGYDHLFIQLVLCFKGQFSLIIRADVDLMGITLWIYLRKDSGLVVLDIMSSMLSEIRTGNCS